MSIHTATISWVRTTDGFTYDTYSRDHQWRFGSGSMLEASAAPRYRGNAALVNPEEAFVSAISSCHMLSFLALAARAGLVVDRYEDAASGVLARNQQGRLSVTRVVLHPRVAFGGHPPATREEIADLHRRAHEECFIAQSVKTEITVEPADG